MLEVNTNHLCHIRIVLYRYAQLEENLDHNNWSLMYIQSVDFTMPTNWFFFLFFWMRLPADSSCDLLNSCTVWNHCIFKHHSYPRTNIKSFRWPVCFLHILHSQAREYCEHLVLKFYTANNFVAWTQTMLAKYTILTLHRTGQSPITVFTGHPFLFRWGPFNYSNAFF